MEENQGAQPIVMAPLKDIVFAATLITGLAVGVIGGISYVIVKYLPS